MTINYKRQKMGSLTFLPALTITVFVTIAIQADFTSATFFHYTPYDFNRHLENFRSKHYNFWHELFRTNLQTRPFLRFHQQSYPTIDTLRPPYEHNEIFHYRPLLNEGPPIIAEPIVPKRTARPPPPPSQLATTVTSSPVQVQTKPEASPIPQPETESPVQQNEIHEPQVYNEIPTTFEPQPQTTNQPQPAPFLKTNTEEPSVWTTARQTQLNELPVADIINHMEENEIQNGEIPVMIVTEGKDDVTEVELQTTKDDVFDEPTEQVFELQTVKDENFEVQTTVESENRNSGDTQTTFSPEPEKSETVTTVETAENDRYEESAISDPDVTTISATDSPTIDVQPTRPNFDLVEFILHDIWNAALDFQQLVDGLTDPLLIGLNSQIQTLQTLIQDSRDKQEVSVGDADKISNQVFSITTHISLQRLRSTLVMEKKQRLENLAKLLKFTVTSAARSSSSSQKRRR